MNLGVSRQNFHSKGVGGPTRDSGSRVTARHVELGLLAIPGVGELGTDNTNQTDGDRNWTQEKGASLFLVGFVDRECCWCCFCLVFFSWCGNRDMICGDVWAGAILSAFASKCSSKNFHQRLSGLFSFITFWKFGSEILENMKPINLIH